MNKRSIVNMYWIVDHLPKRLVYLCAMHVFVYATTGDYSDTEVTKLSMIDAIKRYANDNGLT